MKTIWKFQLFQPVQEIEVQRDARFLHLALQGYIPTVWAEVDPARITQQVVIRTYGTGHPITEGGEYLGTLQDAEGFVWHFYAYRT